MSSLLNAGMSASELAKLIVDINTIKTINLNKIEEVIIADKLFNQVLYDVTRIMKLNTEGACALIKKEFTLDYAVCRFTGEHCPLILLVIIPDGSNKYVKRELLLRGTWDWSFTNNGTIIRNTRLYGDRDVLPYNTNPLDSLKFRCLPTERLEYSTKEDECGNMDYSGVSPVFLGIELEVNRKSNTPKKIEHMVADDLGMDYMILKSDSSIGDGFEIVTAPATIGYHLTKWDKFFENSGKLLSSWSSGKCGMHVHINRSAFTHMHLGKLVAFINNNENREFITTIAGRSSSYSKFEEDRSFHVKSKLVSHVAKLTASLAKATTPELKESIEKEIFAVKARYNKTSKDCEKLIQDIEHAQGDRHVAVNVSGNGGRLSRTVEVRIFRGNLAKVGMLKNLEFVAACVEFTREATFRTHPLTKENTDYALHFTYFIDWLAKDETGNYNNLKTWLQTAKMTDKFAKKKISSKTPPDKRLTDADIRMEA